MLNKKTVSKRLGWILYPASFPVYHKMQLRVSQAN